MPWPRFWGTIFLIALESVETIVNVVDPEESASFRLALPLPLESAQAWADLNYHSPWYPPRLNHRNSFITRKQALKYYPSVCKRLSETLLKIS
jgi:hypothetical protein